MSIKGKIMKELEKRPRRVKELKTKLGNDKKVAHALEELVRANKIFFKDGVYIIKTKTPTNAIACKLTKLGKGFGFAQPLDGTPDIFIPGKFLLGSMPGDEIMVEISKHPRVEGTLEGEVVAMLKEKNDFVGTVDIKAGRLVLIPDCAPSTELVIKKSADGGVNAGEKAACVIIDRADHHEDHRVGISMRFGSSSAAKQCAKAILYGAGIEKSFPAKVKAEAKKYDDAIVSKDEAAKRKDLRDKCIFTIDSASTKDIDDAIHIEKTETGYVLGVHIADVSHYVKPATAIDSEAQSRGTSVYYADRVVPMLPQQLSNGICSLNENVDRLAFSCIMHLDEKGKVIDFSFVKSIICSKIKGVYDEINALLNDNATPEIVEKYSQTHDSLKLMYNLYEHLAAKRAARGSMDIESGEAKLVLDENGVCCDVIKRERGVSECIIEEFMLLANSCAATLARRLQAPFVYRVHESPEIGRIEKLKKLLAQTGVQYKFENDEPNVLELSALLSKTRGTALERPIHTGILRSMAKAKYATEPKGHFGLALEDYAHFTSPIRRYPDLAIHRILTDIISGTNQDDLHKKYDAYAFEAATVSSEREVGAMVAERDIEACYKAEYMHRHIGNDFVGTISSVVPHGIYIELANTVEGLVPIASLVKGEPVIIEGVSVTDNLSGKTYRLGEQINVKVANVNIAKGQIDFEPVK